MIEMALLRPSKETENKLRWTTIVEPGGTDFHIYIPKWRVPKPWPGRIFVSIEKINSKPELPVGKERTTSLAEPIQEIVELKSHQSKTIRFTPLGESKNWQTGEPYIPISLVPQDAKYLMIRVKWDMNSQGEFTDVPTYRNE